MSKTASEFGGLLYYRYAEMRNGVLYIAATPLKPVDPLDVEYDGVKLRVLLERDGARRREEKLWAIRWHQPDGQTGLGDAFATYERAKHAVDFQNQTALMNDNASHRMTYSVDSAYAFTPGQRAVISAHWSAELRAKVDAAKQKDRNQVTLEHDDE